MKYKEYGKLVTEGYEKLFSHRWQSSIVIFKQAIRMYPNLKTSYVGTALALIELDKKDEALKCLNKYLFQLGPNNPLFRDKALLEIDYYKYRDTEKNFWMLLGSLYAVKGETDKAIEAFFCYLKKKPKDQGLWISLVLTYLAEKNYEQAIQTCKEALEVKSKFRVIKILLAHIYNKKNERGKVIELCQETLEADSRFREMNYPLSLMYYLSDKFDEALTAINDALTYRGRTNTYRGFYEAVALKGVILTSNKEFTEAFSLLEMVTHYEPHIFYHWYNLALLYLKMGRYSDGLTACDKSLKINPEFEPCEQLRSRLLNRKSSKEEKDQVIKENFIVADIPVIVSKVAYVRDFCFWENKLLFSIKNFYDEDGELLKPKINNWNPYSSIGLKSLD